MKDKGTIKCKVCGKEMWDTQEKEMKTHEDECKGFDTAKDKYLKGDTVTYTEFAKRRFNKRQNLDRKGEVVGFSCKGDELVRVRWHGNKTASTFHMDFIKNISLEKLGEEHPKYKNKNI